MLFSYLFNTYKRNYIGYSGLGTKIIKNKEKIINEDFIFGLIIISLVALIGNFFTFKVYCTIFNFCWNYFIFILFY